MSSKVNKRFEWNSSNVFKIGSPFFCVAITTLQQKIMTRSQFKTYRPDDALFIMKVLKSYLPNGQPVPFNHYNIDNNLTLKIN